jgi:hypothetical protein
VLRRLFPLVCAVLLLSIIPSLSSAKVRESGFTTDARVTLNTYTALVEEHLSWILKGLKALASTEGAVSGDWERIRGPLSELGKGIDTNAAVWFVRPDGSYCTVEKGLTGQSLSDRTYFPGLMAGNDVEGELVRSKSTGKRSVIIATPIRRDGQVTGGLGASVDMEKLAKMLDERMQLPSDMVFYSIDPQGRTALHRDTVRMFEFPSEIGSRSLRNALMEMLSRPAGAVTYTFGGAKKTALFRKSEATGWVFALGTGGKSKTGELPPILSELQKGVQDILESWKSRLAKAAGETAASGLRDDALRGILRPLCQSGPGAVDCSFVNPQGLMTMVEPLEYRKFEGSDISKQEQVVRLQKTKKPVMSRVFRSVEGFEAVDIEHPVISPGGRLLGSVSVLMRPESFLAEVILPFVHGLPVDVWVMDNEGRILYDPDAEEIGRNLFTDPLYKPFPQLISLGKEIIRKRSGKGSYTFFDTGLKETVKKEAQWATIGLYGTEWRMVVTHVLERTSHVREKEKSGRAFSEESLRDLSLNEPFLSAVSRESEGEITQIFRDFSDSTQGIYSIQWVDAQGINRLGYPKENSLRGVDLRTSKIPSALHFLKALDEKRELSFFSSLTEGRVGYFLLLPLFREGDFLGLLYVIILR